MDSDDKAFLLEQHLLTHWDGDKLTVHFRPMGLNQQNRVHNIMYERIYAADMVPGGMGIVSHPTEGMSITYHFGHNDWQKMAKFAQEFESDFGYDAPNAVPVSETRADPLRAPQKRPPYA